MENQIYIPKVLHVGYQKRTDTYNGKLGYVIYEDDKGKIRKQTSWENWRDKSIQPDIFNNDPTSGFVLNGNVGGARSGGWNPRLEKIRVFDPRGFEIEISLPNLLYILQTVASEPGKALSGEFVYGWDKTDLILIPTNSIEYKKSLEYTKLQVQKLTKNDIHEGWVYLDNELRKLMYLGKFRYNHVSRYGLDGMFRFYSTKDMHIFYDIEKKHFIPMGGYTKLKEIVNDSVADDYAEIVSKYQKTDMFLPIVDIKMNKGAIEYSRYYTRKYFFYKKEDKFYGFALYNGFQGDVRLEHFGVFEFKNGGLYYKQNKEKEIIPESKLKGMGIFELHLKNSEGRWFKLTGR